MEKMDSLAKNLIRIADELSAVKWATDLLYFESPETKDELMQAIGVAEAALRRTAAEQSIVQDEALQSRPVKRRCCG